MWCVQVLFLQRRRRNSHRLQGAGGGQEPKVLLRSGISIGIGIGFLSAAAAVAAAALPTTLAAAPAVAADGAMRLQPERLPCGR